MIQSSTSKRITAVLYGLFVYSLFGCWSIELAANRKTLIVFAAASLTEPFNIISEKFEDANPGTETVLVFGGSQQLATQILEGASADVFASANLVQMERVIDAGWIEEEQVQRFAANRLVIILPDDNPGGIEKVQDLAGPETKLVIAAPEVPVGSYTLAFLEKAGNDFDEGKFKNSVLQNVVSYENDVKAVVAKVALGEADAGIVYASDAGGEAADGLMVLEIPETWNIQAAYPIGPTSQSGNPQLGRAFIDFVLSPQGQAVLAGAGFHKVGNDPLQP